MSKAIKAKKAEAYLIKARAQAAKELRKLIRLVDDDYRKELLICAAANMVSGERILLPPKRR